VAPLVAGGELPHGAGDLRVRVASGIVSLMYLKAFPPRLGALDVLVETGGVEGLIRAVEVAAEVGAELLRAASFESSPSSM
jgi:hypothetical protein